MLLLGHLTSFQFLLMVHFGPFASIFVNFESFCSILVHFARFTSIELSQYWTSLVNLVNVGILL